MKKNPKLTLETVLKLVKNARSDDQTRYFMTEAYYDGGKLVATDGRRLVVYTPNEGVKKTIFRWIEGLEPSAVPDIPTGYVDIDPKAMIVRPSINQIVKGAQFPNYQKVIPDQEAMQATERRVGDEEYMLDYLASLVRFMVRERVAINPEYLLDVPLGYDEVISFHKGSPEEKSRRPVTIKIKAFGEVLVVVMPMMLEDGDFEEAE